LQLKAQALEEKLQHFGVRGKVSDIKRGPVVTLFEYQPAIDTKLSKILALEDDLAMALQALSIRILAPIPGRSVVGFEVANKKREDVFFADAIRSDMYQDHRGALPILLGKDTVGNQVVVDLATMPHLLIAGSTGSGKSMGLNTILMSFLYKLSPAQLRLVLIDPKRLEFALYADIAHLLFPIVTDSKRASLVLRWVVQEMEIRYEQMAGAGVRTIIEYNEKHQPLPYIVVIIDELADLMMTSGHEVEDLITRITQMARAAGIHMIVATQRPSVDVITGLIKVNFPSRISFRVTSKIDSRTIIDSTGADKLLGRGDMLFLDATTATIKRIHGSYVTNQEIETAVTHVRAQQKVDYVILIEQHEQHDSLFTGDEQLYQQVIDFIETVDEVSISLLQRKFRIGYNRSARIIDMLESRGFILPTDGSKTRKVVRS
jgi:DNA segregation ATPase FtsK/SpoIIIE, S-DNA-T family